MIVEGPTDRQVFSILNDLLDLGLGKIHVGREAWEGGHGPLGEDREPATGRDAAIQRFLDLYEGRLASRLVIALDYDSHDSPAQVFEDISKKDSKAVLEARDIDKLLCLGMKRSQVLSRLRVGSHALEDYILHLLFQPETWQNLISSSEKKLVKGLRMMARPGDAWRDCREGLLDFLVDRVAELGTGGFVDCSDLDERGPTRPSTKRPIASKDVLSMFKTYTRWPVGPGKMMELVLKHAGEGELMDTFGDVLAGLRKVAEA